jgi:hypothetical protein
MSETSAAPVTNNTKPCKACGEAIKESARVCIHCNNYQDWRAELNIGSSVLALLVALFGVLTVAIPVIIGAVVPKNSNLSFAFQGANSQTVSMLATNNGIRPGTVTSHIMLIVAVSGQEILIALSLQDSGAAKIIEPAKSVLLDFAPKVTYVDNLDLEKKSCQLMVTSTDFNAKETTTYIPLECENVGALTFRLSRGKPR